MIKLKLVIIVLIMILFGFISGFYAERIYWKNKSEKNIPMPSSFLDSSTLDGLFSNVEGKIIQKQDDSFTIKNGDSRLVIFMEEKIGLTKFIDKDGKEKQFSDLVIGDVLKGGVSMVPNKFGARELANRNPGDVVANILRINAK